MKRRLIFIAVAVAIVILSIAVAADVIYRQSDSAQVTSDWISSRLTAWGVPVQSVRVTGTTAQQVEIILPVERSPIKVNDLSLWRTFLVERVCRLAYIAGRPINSYTTTIVDTKGVQLSSATTFLHPDMFDQLVKASAAQAPLDDAATRDRLIKLFSKFSLPVTGLTVTSGGLTAANLQFVELIQTAPNAQAANQVVNDLMPTLIHTAHQVNKDGDARMAIFSFKLNDTGGTLLVYYLIDEETGLEMWTYAPMIDAHWFPHPAPAGTATIGPLDSPLTP